MEKKSETDLKPKAIEDEYFLDADNEDLVLYFTGFIEELVDEAIKMVEQELQAKENDGENEKDPNKGNKEPTQSEEEPTESEEEATESEEEPTAKVEEKQNEKTPENNDEADEEPNVIEPEMKSKGNKWKAFKKQMKKLFCCCICYNNQNSL